MLLAIDTSTKHASVALAQDGQVISSRSWCSQANHTAELMPAVAEILNGHRLTARDLTGIAVALGPGGFSALRVGISAAKGLALASRKPLVGLRTLDLEAHPYLASGVPVCALLDVGRQEVAAARFGKDGQRLAEDAMGPPVELLSDIAEPTIFCGEAVTGWIELIRECLGILALPVTPSPAARLWSLADLGQRRIELGEADDLATLQPHYLRMPSIGGPKRRDHRPQSSARSSS